MSRMWFGRGLTAFVAVLASVFAACGDPSSSSEGSATLKLTSVPQAQVWVDGKPHGSTPVEVAVALGGHEIVFRQVGFSDRKEMLTVGTSGSQTIEATLLPKDDSDPEALGLLAQALGVPVEPVVPIERHRGAVRASDVVLMYPRSDVRKEGLTSYRVDVSPAFEGRGSLEFRKGRTVLHKQAFEPATLVTTAELPNEVVSALKTGDTVTWGVWIDGQKPITAQFEVVNKPQATRKLAEMEKDQHVQRQQPAVRETLKAQVLQSYRLYSEALVAFLELRATSRDSGLPNGGIAACLRRLNLEDSPLFLEAAAKATSAPRPGRGGHETPGVNPCTGGLPVAGGDGSEGSGRSQPVGPGGAVTPGHGPDAAPPAAGEPAAGAPPADGGNADPAAPSPPTGRLPTAPPGARDPNAPVPPQDPNAPVPPQDPSAPPVPPEQGAPQEPVAPPAPEQPEGAPGSPVVPPAQPRHPELPKDAPKRPNAPPVPDQPKSGPKDAPKDPSAPPAAEQPKSGPSDTPKDPTPPPAPPAAKEAPAGDPPAGQQPPSGQQPPR